MCCGHVLGGWTFSGFPLARWQCCWHYLWYDEYPLEGLQTLVWSTCVFNANRHQVQVPPGDRLIPAGYSFRKYDAEVKWVRWVDIIPLLAIKNSNWWWVLLMLQTSCWVFLANSSSSSSIQTHSSLILYILRYFCFLSLLQEHDQWWLYDTCGVPSLKCSFFRILLSS